MSALRRLLIGLLAVAAAPAAVRAHPLAPVLLELRDAGAGRMAVSWKTPALRPRGIEARPVLPDECEALDAPRRDVEGTGIVTRWTVRCPDLVGRRIGIVGLAGPLTGLLRVVLPDGRTVREVVAPDRPWLVVPAEPRTRDVLAAYLRLGIEHIAGGADHLLFVFGLVLLAGTVRRTLGMVSAFTAGHSVTLSLAVLGLALLPPALTEVAIAASVLALAIELARPGAPASALRRWPWGMALAFGLLHGLGFAGALQEAGLPAGDVAIALLSFNIGIEAGQVAFVAVVIALGSAVSAVAGTIPGWLRQAPVYAMGTLAACWCFERAAVWWR